MGLIAERAIHRLGRDYDPVDLLKWISSAALESSLRKRIAVPASDTERVLPWQNLTEKPLT
jgi:hypothetical protein